MSISKATIAIPTLNRAEYLRLAVESALGQTYRNLEVIVSDNGSTDHTPEVLARFTHDPRLRVFRREHTLSMVENWNSCLAAATGTYFLMLSDDDLLEPEALAAMIGGFERKESAPDRTGMVYCRGRVIDETGKQVMVGPSSPACEPASDLILNFFQSRRMTWACTILFRKSDIEGGYLPEFPLATDAALWMRSVAMRGQAVFLDRVLASYRVHQNITAKTPPALWQKDNSSLAHYAVDLLRRAGRLKPAEEQAIFAACARLNVRLVANLINQNHRHKHLAGLRTYAKHWRDFATVYGSTQAAKGIAQLLFPGISSSLGKVRRRLR